MCMYKSSIFSPIEANRKETVQTVQKEMDRTVSSSLHQERRILGWLADILEEEKLISPAEKVSLKERIENYRGTL